MASTHEQAAQELTAAREANATVKEDCEQAYAAWQETAAQPDPDEKSAAAAAARAVSPT